MSAKLKAAGHHGAETPGRVILCNQVRAPRCRLRRVGAGLAARQRWGGFRF
jgi:hypothetical protein